MKIFQIYYDQKSQQQLDQAFIPYDNSQPSHPDWYEYSVMREVLKKNSFAQDEYIGFFSPQFFNKTGLRGSDVIRYIEQSEAEVISFSPYFHQIVLFSNPFVQGNHYHPGLLELSQDVFNKLGLGIQVKDWVTDQTRSIFCNYFVAKYSFWLKYLELSEQVFTLAQGSSDLALKLNSPIIYDKNKKTNLKVFIMERLVAVVMEKHNINAAIGVNYSKSKDFQSYQHGFEQLMMLEGLKTTYLKTNKEVYLRCYKKGLRQLLAMLNKKQAIE